MNFFHMLTALAGVAIFKLLNNRANPTSLALASNAARVPFIVLSHKNDTRANGARTNRNYDTLERRYEASQCE